MEYGQRNSAIHELLGGDSIVDRETLSYEGAEDFRLPRASLTLLLERISIDFGSGFSKQLAINVATHVYFDTEATHLTKEASEATLRLAEGFRMTAEAVGDERQAAAFLMSENPALGNESPFAVLLEPGGIEVISEVIAKGVHGLPA